MRSVSTSLCLLARSRSASSCPDVEEEWATEDAEYGELLRIAKAVEEARRKSTCRLCKI
jgi:hypothetical protein